MAAARRLDRYELLEEIGAGGMATVYRGRDLELERDVAVKVLHPHLASQPDAKERFQREAKAVAKLRHANILDIYDYSGAESEESYIVVELIHGPTLKRFVEGAKTHDGVPRTTPVGDGVGRVPIEIAVMIVHEICGAIAAAHDHGIIHRDIKPENVMIREDGVLKLTDFGIAQILDANSMTVTGQILGSPAHMAPEQIEAQEIDFRADIFSVGTVLYYLVTGRLPFEGKNPHHLLKKIMDGDYPDPIRVEPAMGERLAVIVRRCLARQPSDRYESADALREDLASFLVDVGYAEPSGELKRYFQAPREYAETHRDKIVPVLIRRGQEERRSGNLPGALDYFNRVLALDEHNREVLRLVGGIERRKRALRYVVTVAGLAALGAAGGLVWAAVVDGGGLAPRPRGRVVDAPEEDPGEVEVRPDTAEPREVTRARDAGPAKGKAGPFLRATAVSATTSAPAVAATRTVLFNPGPCQNVQILVDDEVLGNYGRVLSRELAVGWHRFEYRPNPGARCKGEPFRFNVVPGEGSVRIPWETFSWASARLRVTANADATVTVVGRGVTGRANEILTVPMQAEQEELRVQVSAPGYRTEVRNLNLTAGDVTPADVTLQPESGTPPESP